MNEKTSRKLIAEHVAARIEFPMRLCYDLVVGSFANDILWRIYEKTGTAAPGRESGRFESSGALRS